MAISNGSDVVRINYLGDWGTQFGLLAMAHETFSNDQSDFEVANSSDSSNLAANRMRHYFNLYVKANERAEADPEFRQKALDYFARLENGGDQTALQFWRRVVDDSVRDLKALYSRLGIAFDAWESEHAAAIPAKALVEVRVQREVPSPEFTYMFSFRSWRNAGFCSAPTTIFLESTSVMAMMLA